MSDSQARIGFAVGGLVVGAFFGNPGLGFALGSLAGGLLFPGPDPPPKVGPQLGDLQSQVSAYGNGIPWLFGTVKVAGNIIWNSTIREIAHKSNVGGGGKGGGPQQSAITFTYEVDLAIALCKGPIDGIGRVWADDKLFYDFNNPPHARGINAKIYLGTDIQTPDPLMEADKGVGNVPAYRGLAYVMIRRLDLTPFGNRVPVFHWEVHANGDTTIPVVEVPDVPSGGGTGRIQIDPDTGLIWASRRLNDKVYVFQCNDGLNKICEIDIESPDFLSYQPSFMAIDVSLLGEVAQVLVPPRMFIGQTSPDGINDVGIKGYATDGSCRLLKDISAPFNDSFFCWPGAVIVDQSSIDPTGPNFSLQPTLIGGLTNGACFTATTIGLSPFADSGQATSPFGDNPWSLSGLEHVADWVQAGEQIAGVDWDGRIFLIETASGSLIIDQTVLGAASFANRNNSITYDPEEERLYTKIFEFGGNIKIAKWDMSLNQIWEFDAQVPADNNYNPVRIRYHTSVGDVWTVGRDNTATDVQHVKKIDKENGGFSETFSFSLSGVFDDFQPFPGAPFAVGTKSSSPGSVVKFPLGPGASASPPTLASVVTTLVEGSEELTASDIDVTSLVPFTVRGYAIAERMPIRNTIEPLMQSYFFDAAESDDKVKFVRRGTSPVVNIPPEHLNTRRDGDQTPGDQIKETRTDEPQLPVSLDLRYISLDTEYKIGVVNSRRLIGDSHQQRTQNVPVVFNATEAKAITDVLLHNTWFERNNKQIMLLRRYLFLDPTDVITITSPDQGEINVRINQMGVSLPSILELSVSEEDMEIYTGYISPGPFGLQPQPTFPITVPVVLVVMDISTLRSIDDNTGVYVVGYAIGGEFRAADVLQSPDGFIFGPGAALGTAGNVGFADTRLTWEGSFS